jgi:hypothetical protein
MIVRGTLLSKAYLILVIDLLKPGENVGYSQEATGSSSK